jgi:hypothetical protein
LVFQKIKKSKNQFLIIALLIGCNTYAQDNTLPTTGNVGIGTLNPTTRLDVNGNMKVDSCLHVKDTLVVDDDARIMNDMRVEGETELLGDTKIDGTLYLTNVATTTDTSDFEVLVYRTDGSVAKTTFAALSSGIDPNPPTGDDYFCTSNSSDILQPEWWSGASKLYTVCPEIKVGIATQNPRVSLDVNGTSITDKLYIGTVNPNAAEVQNELGNAFRMKVPYQDNIDRKIFIIENDARKLMELNNNGLLKAREIRIDALPWADFVFQPDYSLKPLSEVESFIKTNGHLPDVPSEAEVKQNGINVAEMDAILLRKIEELTLHSIAQEKRIADLEEKLNSLTNDK